MDDASEISGTPMWKTMLYSLRPAVPAVIGGAALTFLFAAVMPFAWVAAISWNLYLDRLSDLFVSPIGNGGRLALALGMAALAALIAGLVALVVAKPEETGFSSLRRHMRRRSEIEADDADALPRRRADLHPDDPPRPPIRAGRDLPAEGLGPLIMPVSADYHAETDRAFATPVDAYDDGDELMLADLAPEEQASTVDEPWLQPAEMTPPPAMSDPSGTSLSAMVARLEAGLACRRPVEAVATNAPAMPDAPAASTGDAGVGPEVDFALEAALGTLQRMTRQAVG